MMPLTTEQLEQADGLIVAAGAGMGVDSGLHDFRGTEGFWKAYPALGREKDKSRKLPTTVGLQLP